MTNDVGEILLNVAARLQSRASALYGRARSPDDSLHEIADCLLDDARVLRALARSRAWLRSPTTPATPTGDPSPERL